MSIAMRLMTASSSGGLAAVENLYTLDWGSATSSFLRKFSYDPSTHTLGSNSAFATTGLNNAKLFEVDETAGIVLIASSFRSGGDAAYIYNLSGAVQDSVDLSPAYIEKLHYDSGTSLLFLCLSTDEIKVYDVSDPTNITLTDTLSGSGIVSDRTSIRVDSANNVAFILTNQFLNSYSISSGVLTLLQSVAVLVPNSSYQNSAIDLERGYFFCGQVSNSGTNVVIRNINNPSSMAYVYGFAAHSSACRTLHYDSEGQFLIYGYEGGAKIYDVSTITSPSLIATITNSNLLGPSFYDQAAYDTVSKTFWVTDGFDGSNHYAYDLGNLPTVTSDFVTLAPIRAGYIYKRLNHANQG